MKIITVDAGKYNTKAMTDNNRILFRTKLQQVDNLIYNQTSNSHHIKWKNNDYIFGDGVKLIDYETSKRKLQHKLAAYISCSKLLNEIDEIGLVILSPLSTFSDKQKREEFRQYIIDDGLINFDLDGIKSELIIKDVTVFAEALGTAFANSDKFKRQLKGIIDIGGANVNGVIVSNMTPIKGTEFTINEGSYFIMEKIKKELNKQLEVNIQDYQMDYIIKQGYYNYNKETSSEIIQSILSDHFNEIIQNMRANNWDTNGIDIVVTGGGSLNLGIDNISKYIPQVQMSNNPIWDNCIGGNLVGEMIYGE